MKELAKKFSIVLVILLLSPLIVFGFLCGIVFMFFDWLKEPARKREYRRSHYYKDFLIPYRRNITYEDSYQFYNEARNDNHSIKMIHPSNGGPDYLIIQDSIFLFPMCQDVFGGISYNTQKCEWVVDFDGESFSLNDEWEKYKRTITDIGHGLPCYLLIKQCDLNPCHNDSEEFSENYALDLLPPYVHIVQQYIDIITGAH